MNEQTNLAYDTTFKPFICTTCKTPITEPAMHGWVYNGYDFTNMKTHLEPCPTCSDTAIARRKTEQIDRLLGKSHIPLRMAEWSFTTLPRDVDWQAKEHAVKFSNAQTEKQATYFHGNVGGGKTGLAISIIVWRSGVNASTFPAGSTSGIAATRLRGNHRSSRRRVNRLSQAGITNLANTLPSGMIYRTSTSTTSL